MRLINPQRTRVKICGITCLEDAHDAVQLGADAIGLVFYLNSSRHLSFETAKEIASNLPPFVASVALTVDATLETIETILEEVNPSVLQFHGDEPPEFCRQFKRPYLKALRVRSESQIHEAMSQYADATGLLLDAYVPDKPGGTGKTFNWDWIPNNPALPIVLAGGLTADNVGRAIHLAKPYGVDVSGGVEATPGGKSKQKLRAFFDAVALANQTL